MGMGRVMGRTVIAMTSSEDRYSRQASLVPAEKLATCHVTVVGVGAIGRQVALQLAAIGCSHLILVDPDTVELVNLPTQGYRERDLGRAKVEATAEDCHSLNTAATIIQKNNRFQRSQNPGNILFCCVDSIETRKLIWQAVQGKVILFVDARAAGETIRVLTAGSMESREHYPGTLFRGEEAVQAACTAKLTVYVANIAAGIMVAQFAKWLRGLPTDSDLLLNLLSAELTVGV